MGIVMFLPSHVAQKNPVRTFYQCTTFFHSLFDAASISSSFNNPLNNENKELIDYWTEHLYNQYTDLIPFAVRVLPITVFFAVFWAFDLLVN